MIEFARLEVEDVLEINATLCADTGENSVCLDRGGLEGAVEKPWAGFGDEAFYPSVFDKAAALLHALASRQFFENGNKRTAWTSAVAFLDINGVDLGRVETVHADMFVRAAGLDHSLEIPDIAEWLSVTCNRGWDGGPIPTFDHHRAQTLAAAMVAEAAAVGRLKGDAEQLTRIGRMFELCREMDALDLPRGMGASFVATTGAALVRALCKRTGQDADDLLSHNQIFVLLSQDSESEGSG